jgi:magnesium transporter
VGTVSVKDLFMAEMDAVVSDIMETNVISVDAYEDKEMVAQAFSKYGMLALPVVDKDGRIVGIVTVDDAIDVMEEEATEDIERMAAIISTDKPYLKTGVFSIWLTRIPWLLLLMLSATFTGIIINSFESALSVFPVLISFIPMLMGTGGNAGGQSSATVIRGMAVGEIELRDILKVLWKELRVALLCGVTLAVVGYGKIILIDNLLLNMNVSYMEMAVVSLTLVVTVFAAKLVGCSLPILAKAIRLDPAVMASPFITTIVDVLSLIVYFFIAMRILEM